MAEVTADDFSALFLILYLFPGFVGSVVYDYLVERPSPSNFERIIEALVLTLVSSVVAHRGFGVPLLPDLPSTGSSMAGELGAFFGTSIFYVSLASGLIAGLFAIFNNHKFIYRLLNWLRITYKNGEDDVWKDTFYKHRGFWISLTFEDDSILIGWPQYYSQSGKPREIFVAEPTWWRPDAEGNLVAVEGAVAGVYVSDFSKVRILELLDGIKSKRGDRKWWNKLGDRLRKVLGCAPQPENPVQPTLSQPEPRQPITDPPTPNQPPAEGTDRRQQPHLRDEDDLP